MMRLSLMWRGVNSLGPEWTWPLAEKILKPWGFDPGSVRYFRASANFVCVLRQEGRRRFLRFNLDSERPRKAVEAEAHLVEWLYDQGLPVARPIRSAAGRLVETVQTDLGSVNAILFDGLPGAHREVDELDADGFQRWGAALGRLHSVMQRYADPSALDRESWREHLQLGASYIRPEDEGLQAELHRLTAWTNALPTGPDEMGLIHFDFESDNLCWSEQGEIGMLDFDDSARHWYVADIAYALRDLFQEGVDLAHPHFRAFVQGYEQHRPVNRELMGEIPMFLRLHRMHQFGRLVRALDLPADADLPEWLAGINTKLSATVARYRTELRP